jgi:hypothetical protein
VSFHVSPYALYATGSAIGRLGDEIVSAVGTYAVGLDAGGAAAATASTAVADAVEELVSAWSAGLTRLGQHAEGLGLMARIAAGRYEVTEASIIETLPARGDGVHRR